MSDLIMDREFINYKEILIRGNPLEILLDIGRSIPEQFEMYLINFDFTKYDDTYKNEVIKRLRLAFENNMTVMDIINNYYDN
jgi:hypothetical protein